jgi:hypothetical protein
LNELAISSKAFEALPVSTLPMHRNRSASEIARLEILSQWPMAGRLPVGAGTPLRQIISMDEIDR